MYFAKNKKALFIAVIAAALSLVLSSFSPVVHSETSNSFTVPCTINTYGNAWDGELTFGLSGTVYALVVMSTNGSLINSRESSSAYGVAYNIGPNAIMFQGEPQVDGSGSVQLTPHISGILLQTQLKISQMSLAIMTYNMIQRTIHFSHFKTTLEMLEIHPFYLTRLCNFLKMALFFGAGTPMTTYHSAKHPHSTKQQSSMDKPLKISLTRIVLTGTTTTA